MKLALMLVCLTLIAACTPSTLPLSERNRDPQIQGDKLLTSDGNQLALKQWPSDDPAAIIVALHGYNDYSRSFEMFSEAMSSHNIHVVAYDHRGFGQNDNKGIWAGITNLTLDAKDAITAIHNTHPTTPVFLLGSSMGGAIAIELVGEHKNLPIDGIILNAPAIWGGETMNPIPKAMLWMAAHITPGKTFTGEGLKIQPTDNVDVLREMARDPNIIKASRVDSVYHLVGLMDHAYKHKHVLTEYPTLLLYGLKDEVVPPTPIYHLAQLLPESDSHIYEEGYHMLLRDNQRAKVFDDISSWVLSHAKH